MNVSYDLMVTTLSKACPEDSSTGAAALEERINGTNVKLPLNFVWTSKIFYTLFHPAMVNRLQPQLVQNIVGLLDTSQATTALTWDGTESILTVEVLLSISLPCAPTLAALEFSLDDLTSVVRRHNNACMHGLEWRECMCVVLISRYGKAVGVAVIIFMIILLYVIH